MKTKKSARKFAASGKLKKAIEARHKHQQIKKKIESRRGRKGKATARGNENSKRTGKAPLHPSNAKSDEEDEEDLDEDVDMQEGKAGGHDLSESEDEVDGGASQDENEDSDDSAGEEDDASFASLDELEDDGEAHLMELSKLAEKDPEFYKYLQENDQELLDFKPDAVDAISDEEMEEGIPEDDEDEETPILTQDILRGWQKALLEHRSLRAFRKLLIAFRAAAYANDENANLAWTINNSTVFDKVVTTALKYAPVVLDHHIPYRTLPDGKYKPPIQSTKQQSLTRLTCSFFNSILHLLSQITDAQMLVLCITESTKLVPYVVGNRKVIKAYLKACLGLWSSPNVDGERDGDEEAGDGADKVRIAAYLGMRRIAMAHDESLLDAVLKGTYLTLVRNCKSTSVHSLPAINLMKNTAVDLYSIDPAASYQHGFGYIRQLAVNLRNTLKAKPNTKENAKEGKEKSKSTQEPYKQVYNWQFVHCIDFWSMILSRNCAPTDGGEESELQPLIYPLVQVTLGGVKLVQTARYYPLHLHLLRALQTLSHSTRVYIPLAPYLVPIITTVSTIQKPKSSTLKPLDFDVLIRVPSAYLKTKILVEGICDEALYLLAEWAADVQMSVAFPETMVPVVVGLKRCLKIVKEGGKGDGKVTKGIKTLVERIEEGREWSIARRRTINFGPADRSQVDKWERQIKVHETPLGKYTTVLNKARERNRRLLEKARQGKGEYLDQ